MLDAFDTKWPESSLHHFSMDNLDSLLVEAEDDRVKSSHELLSLMTLRKKYRQAIAKLMAEHSLPKCPLPQSYEALACMYDELRHMTSCPHLKRAWLANNADDWLQLN